MLPKLTAWLAGNWRAAQRGNAETPLVKGQSQLLRVASREGAGGGGGWWPLAWACLQRKAEEGGQACWKSRGLRGGRGRVNTLAPSAWQLTDPARPVPDAPGGERLSPWGSGYDSP